MPDVGDEKAAAAAKASMVEGLLELAGAMVPLEQGPFFLGNQFSLVEVALLPWWQRAHSVLKAYRGFELPPMETDPRVERLEAWGTAVEKR